jgi:broad specificity phosphatase PhoE
LLEIDYGACDGLSIADARQRHPELFTDWKTGNDPRFPCGENTADVLERLQQFLGRADAKSKSSLICTHNVVLRCLVGEGLGVPRSHWHRIDIPHLAPISVVQTRDHGWFVDLEESVEQHLFANFLFPGREGL